MSRTRICAGNWKLNKTPEETHDFFQELATILEPTPARCLFFPPAYNLYVLKAAATQFARHDVVLEYGPQNIYCESEGAFTGEISPAVVRAMGATFALIGHSERRTLFGENDELISRKVQAAAKNNLVPMLCVGETLAERDAGQTNAVVARQLQAGLAPLLAGGKTSNHEKCESVGSLFVIAYEPVWAIGTGRVATPEQAEAVHVYVRKVLRELVGESRAEATSVLYGGSVKPDNAAGLASQPNIDGFLIGGASLKPRDFAAIAATLRT